MELYHLKTFVTVADEKHLTRAAEKLHTSQPAVSAHIKAIEEDLGVSLFKRTPKGMQTTAAGEVLKEKAAAILDMVNNLAIQAKQLRSELKGSVSIGLNIDPKYLKLSELYANIKNNYPGLELHMLQKTSWEVQTAIRKGELDVGFVYGQVESSELEIHSLTHFNLLIAGPPDWKDKLQTEDLDGLLALPWIWTSDRCSFSRTFSSLVSKQKITPIKAAVSDQESTLKTLAASGVGLILMMEEEALDAAADGVIAVREVPVDSIELSVVVAKKQVDDPAIKATVKSIQEVWTKREPEVCE